MATEKAGETEVTILFQNERVRVAEMRARPGNRGKMVERPDRVQYVVKGGTTISFDNCFLVQEIRVIKSPTGLVVSFPAKKQRDGTYWDIAFPANAETRNMIQHAILAEYKKVVAQSDGKVDAK